MGLTEGAALGGEVGELDLEVDALAVGAAGGRHGALDVAVDVDGAEGGVGELGDVGDAGGVIVHGDGISELLREGSINGALRDVELAKGAGVDVLRCRPRRRRPRGRRRRATGSAW